MDPATLPLNELLSGVPARISGDPSAAVSGVAYRSDRVRPGDAFFCVPGFVRDGHDFAADAVAHGAAALVTARELDGFRGVVQAVVPDVRAALAQASAVAYGHPTRSLHVVGITGTNGKTTTTYLLDSILRAAGRVTGLIGTVETRVAGLAEPARRTTPESTDLQALFAKMAEAGCSTVSMEVSSHAIYLHRVDAVRFAVAAFTNLSQDHLDFHKTLEEYVAVKRRLFTEMDVGARVLCIDDQQGAILAAQCGGECITVGLSRAADVRAEDVVCGPDSSTFRLVTPEGEADVRLPLAASFNVANALVAAGCALGLGIDTATIAKGLADAPQVPGRLERVDAGQPFTVLVDYAHTPDGLDKAAEAVKAVTPGRLITVFGCGGDRDPEKRAPMGEAAARHSDEIVVTTDNPRSEDPVGIILQIEDGLRAAGARYSVEPDRRRAIALALGMARAGDTVLLAGKGHEDYQEAEGVRTPFDDRVVAREELAGLAGADGGA